MRALIERVLLSLLVGSLVVACGGDPSSSTGARDASEEAGDGADAAPADGGRREDASTETDAGEEPELDAGRDDPSAPPDAGFADAGLMDGGTSDSGTPDGGPVTDFVASGTQTVVVTEASLAAEDCMLPYDLYTPGADDFAPLVVLGHGFSRSRTQMAGIARHLASHGMRVAVPGFCHLSPFDTDHVQNGRDAALLSAALAEGGPVVHAGYSAGGLAALLAAIDDPLAVGVLGLDLVDAEGLAAGAVAMLSLPMLGLVGESSACNANNNGNGLYPGSDRWGVRIEGATHCDFEDPTDGLCTTFCGGVAGVVPVIRALAAAFSAWQLGLDATGEAWSSPAGSEWQRLEFEGALDPL